MSPRTTTGRRGTSAIVGSALVGGFFGFVSAQALWFLLMRLFDLDPAAEDAAKPWGLLLVLAGAIIGGYWGSRTTRLHLRRLRERADHPDDHRTTAVPPPTVVSSVLVGIGVALVWAFCVAGLGVLVMIASDLEWMELTELCFQSVWLGLVLGPVAGVLHARSGRPSRRSGQAAPSTSAESEAES